MAAPDPSGGPPLPHLVLAELAVGKDWLGTWLPTVVLGAACVVLVGVLTRDVARRRRLRRDGLGGRGGPGGLGGRRVHRTWILASAALLTLLLSGAFAVNTKVGYVPNTSAAWLLITGDHTLAQAGTGQSASVTIPTPVGLLMPDSTTWVYTPPGYDPAGSVRYPVVYLIHGTPGQSSDWVTGGDVARVMDVLIAHHLVRPMIIVAPEVNGAGQDDTECLDSTVGGSQVESYLSGAVVPWVDAHYATLADWPYRVIGGMSSGGFCALDQGLRHPELYGSIIALEPFGAPGDGGRSMLRTPAEYVAHSPSDYLRTMTFTHPVPTFLDIGDRGERGADSLTGPLAEMLTARGQTVLSRVEPNQTHSWTMARTGIPYGLIFVSGQMPG